MKLLFACFLVCAFSFNLINTTPISEVVLYGEIFKSIDILHKSIKVVSTICIFLIINYYLIIIMWKVTFLEYWKLKYYMKLQTLICVYFCIYLGYAKSTFTQKYAGKTLLKFAITCFIIGTCKRFWTVCITKYKILKW